MRFIVKKKILTHAYFICRIQHNLICRTKIDFWNSVYFRLILGIRLLGCFIHFSKGSRIKGASVHMLS